jgi:hypothetical protein
VQNEKTDFRAIDRLVDRGREIDRLAIGPHALVPALTQQIVRASRIIAWPAARIAVARRARIEVIPRELVSSLASALRSLPETGVG